MSEIFRTRDVVVFTKGVAYTVAANPALKAAGWGGGQGLMWSEATTDDLQVTFSDGVRGAGFALWGSNESSDILTSITGHQALYGFVVLCSGSWIISTTAYEIYTLASRLAGPLVPLVYSVTDKLRFSNRGLFTIEDEWTIDLDPRAPNGNYVASVVQEPQDDGWLTLQTSF